MRCFAALTCVVVLCAAAAFGQTIARCIAPDGLEQLNHFAGRVTDADVRSAADMLVSTGMRDVGYIYVNVDDTVAGRAGYSGVLHPNERFPGYEGAGRLHPFEGAEVRDLLFARELRPAAGMRASLGHEAAGCEDVCRLGRGFSRSTISARFEDEMKKVRAEHPDDR